MEINYALEIVEEIFVFLLVTQRKPECSGSQANIYFRQIQLLDKMNLPSLLCPFFLFFLKLLLLNNNNIVTSFR